MSPTLPSDSHRFRTLLVGIGKIGAGYADDPVMAEFFEFATHAQILSQHPGFSWDACVDPSLTAQAAARDRWGVATVASSVAGLPKDYDPDVVVVATPPEVRSEIIDAFPNANGFFLEKPIGYFAEEAHALIDRCESQGALVQVGLWRRADTGLRRLAAGDLMEKVGQIQCLMGVYGNGLRNNGTHMIDLVRMLAGEIISVQAMPGVKRLAGPLNGDVDISFHLHLENGIPVFFSPVDFKYYRENGLEVWGRSGRLSVLQEGLVARVYSRKANRAVQNEWEIDGDVSEKIPTTPGRALYNLYSNLAAALSGEGELWSSGKSAMHSEIVVDAVMASLDQGCARVDVSF